MADTTIGTSVAIATPDLEIIEGQITTTSQQIAAHFNKRHDNVMRAIRSVGAEAGVDFYRRNFEEVITEFTNGKGGIQKAPAYRITRDGFTLLAMGFTGKEAMQWKVAYLTAFNKMEQELLARTTRPANPAIDYDRISPAQAQDLKELVHSIAESKVQGFAETWARLHRKFRVNSYLELPATRFAEARDYLLGKLPAESQMANQTDMLAMMQLAQAAATEAGAHVQREVFRAVMEGGSDMQHHRLVLSLAPERADAPKAHARHLDRNAFITTWPRLVKDVANGEAMCTSEELIEMASACMQRLQQRSTPARLAA